MVIVRAEAPGDEVAIRAVQEAAFPTPEEADLVDDLRQQGESRISLVAETGGRIIGHVLFSPVTLDGVSVAHGLGLAPLAVLPDWQKRGVGTQLAQEGLRGCRAAGAGFVVVLGEQGYYQRFGFVPAMRFRLGNEYGAMNNFQALVWEPAALPAQGGLIRYAEPFRRFGP